MPAADLVHRLRLLTFSGSHPGIADGRVMTPEEIVDTVLFGLVRRDGPTGPEPHDEPPRDKPVDPHPTSVPTVVSRHPAPKGTDMLMRLLRRHLRPYRGQIAVIVLAQFVSTMASLYLPSLNGEIIDQGVARATPASS